MIPRIDNLSKVDAVYDKYLKALADAGFRGEIEDSYGARLLCSTDNSVYQRMPQAVIFPKDTADVSKAFKTAYQPAFSSVILTARGGGTGTNGQSLNDGVVIDMSRHMKEFSDVNALRKCIFVQSGVIKDELNEAIAPYNLFFSPELSTSSRATVGGMISNDAAGQGSLRYGRTSEHINKIEAVLRDGSVVMFGPVSGEALQEKLQGENLEGEIYRSLYAMLKENAESIRKHFPKLNRFLTGYDLYHAYDPETDTLNLARIICGAEGTLCAVTGAELDLTLKPVFRSLCVITYDSFDSALRHAEVLIKAGAFSAETVDSKVLSLAKKDPVWLTVSDYIPEREGCSIEGINIVEFNGYDTESGKKLADALYQQVLKDAENRKGGVLGVSVADTAAGIAAVYGMRKKAVGLLGATAGSKKPVAFTEDTVVPPEKLADYIAEFRALLDSLNVSYGMFGHVDTGLMHVRPALDLTLEEDKRKLVTISEEVVKLVKKYGGQMWGEHGRGYRSVFGEQFFGELYPLARKVKAAFDPDNRINPGKICVPFGNEKDSLVALDDPMRGDLDRLISVKVREQFDGAVSCNGNGQCFSYSTSSLMCPSYRYTKDHVKSPKGYSGLMREWLRLMSERGFDAAAEEELLNRPHSFAAGLKSLIARTLNSLKDKDDFNHEYLKDIETCLSCKSCKTQCPAHVNAADLNSRFLNFYYSRYLRPSMDILCLNAEKVLPPVAAYAPRLANKIMGSALSRKLCEKVFKFTDLPSFSEVPLAVAAARHRIPVLSGKRAVRRAAYYDVIIVTDAFTVSFDTEGLLDLGRLIRGLGFRVAFLKPYVNGKLFAIRGAGSEFIKYATRRAEHLSDLEGMGVTLVGFDPALTLCFRDEYRSRIKNCPEFNVLLPEEWLVQALSSERFLHRKDRLMKALDILLPEEGKNTEALFLATGMATAASSLRRDGSLSENSYGDFRQDYFLFCHCTEQALVPLSVRQWQQVMAAFRLNLKIERTACCGMAGLFGHMVKNVEESKSVYAQNWQDKIRSHSFRQCLITGFSCRSQVERMEGRKPNHPIHVLASLVEKLNDLKQP